MLLTPWTNWRPRRRSLVHIGAATQARTRKSWFQCFGIQGPQEARDMHKAYRYLGSFFLTGARLAPVAIRADVGSQERGEERREQRERREQQERHRRYYDRDRRDWHEWDEREDRAYRRYL